VPDDGLFGEGIRLGCILVPGGFVCERLDELVGENLNVCALVRGLLKLNGLLPDLEVLLSVFRLLLLSVFHVFQSDQRGMGVPTEDTLIPHEIVVNEFAMEC
jgi:hypothetical protein